MTDRNKKSLRVAAFMGMLAVTATVALGGVLHAQAAETVDEVAATATLQRLSAEIPKQPAADPETGKLVESPAFAAMNEPVWTRTCDRGQGTEIWNDRDPKICAGTMSYYYYNVRKFKFNMLKFIVTQPKSRKGNPSALLTALDKWCGDHSFQCNIVTGVLLLPAALIFSHTN